MALERDDSAEARVIYLPGLSEGMIRAGALFDYVALRYHNGSRTVAVSGSDGEGMDERSKPGEAWPGKSWYIEELGKRGVSRADIIPLEGPQRHSRQETDALVNFAKLFKWRRIVMVSVDYHRPRQILGCIRYMNEIGWKTALYLPSIPFDWDAEMLGSQQREVSTGRAEALTDWNVKIGKYQSAGHLCSIQEFRDYMSERRNWG